MVELQIISKILRDGTASILENNQITPDFFPQYTQEINYILDHREQYGNIPDKETFLEKFPDFDILEVSETERYLVDTIREEHLYGNAVPIVQKFAELLKSDANEAAEYLKSQLQYLQPNYNIGGIDITKQSDIRYTEYQERKANQKNFYFDSGFKELDDIIHGIQRGEELLVLVARLGQGKSWVLLKMAVSIWAQTANIGYLSPEMSYNTIGYRIDTLLGHFSNSNLMHGNDEESYHEFIEGLKNKESKFVVATPKDFNKKVTVSKLRNFVEQYQLQALFIDGIKYLSDERGKKGDNLTTSLTNISEDLMELSVELGIPVIVVVQANRGGVSDANEDDTPELESIRDSDGIAHNASKVISLKQKADSVLVMSVKKNRFGKMGSSVSYAWNIDRGEFNYLSTNDKETSRRRKSDEGTTTTNSAQNKGKNNVF